MSVLRRDPGKGSYWEQADTQYPTAGGLHVAGGGVGVSSDLKGALTADHELPLWASDY